MIQKQDILTLIDELPDSEHDSLKEYLLFLKHKSYIIHLAEDRKEEITLANHSLKHLYNNESGDNVYDKL